MSLDVQTSPGPGEEADLRYGREVPFKGYNHGFDKFCSVGSYSSLTYKVMM